MNEDDPNSDIWREAWHGELHAAFYLFRTIALQEGWVPSNLEEVSEESARALARELILATDVDQARAHMRRDQRALRSFAAWGHEVCDLSRGGQIRCVDSSDGRHGPFVLLASAVLNFLDDES